MSSADYLVKDSFFLLNDSVLWYRSFSFFGNWENLKSSAFRSVGASLVFFVSMHCCSTFLVSSISLIEPRRSGFAFVSIPSSKNVSYGCSCPRLTNLRRTYRSLESSLGRCVFARFSYFLNFFCLLSPSTKSSILCRSSTTLAFSECFSMKNLEMTLGIADSVETMNLGRCFSSLRFLSMTA